MLYFLILILTVYILWCSYCRLCATDHFDNFANNYRMIEKQSIKNKNNQQLFNDVTFDDVVYYENDNMNLKSSSGSELGSQSLSLTGLEKCMNNKAGYCVEYGITGNAYYYPPSKSDKNYGEIINMDDLQKHLYKERTSVTSKNVDEYLHYPIF